jgi:hypothetical protein
LCRQFITKSECVGAAAIVSCHHYSTTEINKGELFMNTIATKITVKTTRGWKTLYWASTIIAVLTFASIGTADLVGVPKVSEGLVHLGYPPYLAMILGMWMLLGSAAIILPGLPRLKEWAYAGLFFLFTGAAISHTVVGDSLGHIFVPLVLLATVMTSWLLQPSRGDDGRRVAKMYRGAAWLVGDNATDLGGASIIQILGSRYIWNCRHNGR